MSTILQDDYVEVFGANIPGAAFWTEGGDSPNHSVKITVWENGKIKETQEKFKESGVYKRVYDPPIDPPANKRYWKPK
jgi:hypothetical protein